MQCNHYIAVWQREFTPPGAPMGHDCWEQALVTPFQCVSAFADAAARAVPLHLAWEGSEGTQALPPFTIECQSIQLRRITAGQRKPKILK